MRGRRLVAVLVEEGRRTAAPVVVERSEEGSCELLENLDRWEGLDYALILPDWLSRADGLARLAHAHGVVVWIAPAGLVEAVRILTGVGPPRRYAAALARLPLTAFRSQLRRVDPADRRQLTLWGEG